MNKTQLVEAINDRTGIPKKDVALVLDTLGQVAQEEMRLETGEITLPGIGKLKAGTREARSGRNPATGEAIEIPAKNIARFAPAKSLEDAIN